MANVAHSTLTGSNLHETKGMASATDDYVLTATSGAGVYKKLTASNLTGTGNPFGAQLLHVRDSAAFSYSAGSWQTRVLSTVVTNEISSASLASNQISLPAGTYYIDADISGYSFVNFTSVDFLARLYNITTSTALLYSNMSRISYSGSVGGAGVSSFSMNGSGQIALRVRGRFTLAGTTTLELQSYSTTGGTFTSSEAVAGLPIINTQALIWKVA